MVRLQEYVDRKVKGMLGELNVFKNHKELIGGISRLDKFLRLAEGKGADCHNYRVDSDEIERKYMRRLMKIDC